MNRKSIHLVWVLLLIGGGVIWLILKGGFPPPTPPGQSSNAYPHLRWGNPSGATKDESNRDNYLMEKPYFALSYNDAKGTPNWVSWRLVRDDLGHTPRNNQQFRADDDLPAGFKKVLNPDYDGCGFDRGHMCPFGDRTATDESGTATFILTNAVPQSPNDNRKGWEQFEEYCRTLVTEQGKELYIVAGPQGQGGVGSKGPATTLPRNHGVVVPARTWKVVMVLAAGAAPDRDTRLIAVDMPNDQTVGEDWRKYVTSVKAVEALTGYTFFGAADQSVIGSLKGKIDDGR